MRKSYYTTVYRIEHPTDGKGPYRSSRVYDDDFGDLLHDMMSKHSIYVSPNHPAPQLDGISSDTFYANDMQCACATLKQLKQWFGEFITPLCKSGFHIVKYYVPRKRVYYGRHQVVFDPMFSPFKVILNHKTI